MGRITLAALWLLCANALPLFAVENEECLACHSDPELVKVLPSGDTLSLFVDEERFATSVHGLNELACTDCHSDIEELNYDQEVPHPVPLQPVDCAQCHDAEAEAYAQSIHAQLRAQGKNAPSCAQCHAYHYTKYLYADNVLDLENKFCLRCHDPYAFHAWLPQKATHFRHVMCTVCHAEGVSPRVHLRVFDRRNERFVSGQELLKTLGLSEEAFLETYDQNGNGTLDLAELEHLKATLHQKGIHAVFFGEMGVDLTPEVHQVTKARAVSTCESCHTPDSPNLQQVVFVVSKPTGEAEFFEVNPVVLRSPEVSNFYLLNATRIPLLDRVGLVILLLGVAFAVGHGLLRALTTPIRRNRRKAS